MDPLLLSGLIKMMRMEMRVVMYASIRTFLGPGRRLEMILMEKLQVMDQDLQ